MFALLPSWCMSAMPWITSIISPTSPSAVATHIPIGKQITSRIKIIQIVNSAINKQLIINKTSYTARRRFCCGVHGVFGFCSGASVQQVEHARCARRARRKNKNAVNTTQKSSGRACKAMFLFIISCLFIAEFTI